VWPLDRTRPKTLLRIGRVAIERWQAQGTSFALASSHAFHAELPPAAEHLAAGLKALLADDRPAQAALVLESAWLPLLLADTGGLLWSAAQADTLVRHRFSQSHDDPAEPVARWELRMDFRPGERFLLAHGLAPSVKAALTQSAQDLGLAWTALWPAFEWGWHRLGRHAARDGWWAWMEQDRCVMASRAGGRWDGLHPALPLPDDAAAVAHLVEAEALRLGRADAAVLAACWRPAAQLPRSSERVGWRSVCEEATA